MSGKKYLVYKHTNKVNGLVYIGITCQKPERRWRNGYGYKPGKDENGNEKSLYFWNAIQKYGWDGFDHLILVRGLTKEEAEWLEIQLIAAYDSTDRSKGYNLTKGGGGTNGYHPTEETRKKQSESSKGEKNSMFGRCGKDSPSSKPIICITTGMCFDSATIASEYYKHCKASIHHISSCCHGKRRQSGSLPDGTPLRWKYIKDLPKPQVSEDTKQLLRNGPKPLKIVC